jgi:hypothetical protein
LVGLDLLALDLLLTLLNSKQIDLSVGIQRDYFLAQCLGFV